MSAGTQLAWNSLLPLLSFTLRNPQAIQEFWLNLSKRATAASSFCGIKLNFNFKVCPTAGNLSPPDDLLLSTAVKVLVEQMIKSHKRRPQKLLATRGTRHVRLGHRLGKLAPLSFLAKGKFDVKLCELSLFSVHRQTDTLSCLAELSLTGCGMRHAACGTRRSQIEMRPRQLRK